MKNVKNPNNILEILKINVDPIIIKINTEILIEILIEIHIEICIEVVEKKGVV